RRQSTLSRRRRCTFTASPDRRSASTLQELAPPIGTECRPGSFCDWGRGLAAPAAGSRALTLSYVGAEVTPKLRSEPSVRANDRPLMDETDSTVMRAKA